MEAHRTATLTLSLPSKVRLAQGKERAWLVVQPKLASPDISERPAIITTMYAVVDEETAAANGQQNARTKNGQGTCECGATLLLAWTEQGAWRVTPGQEPSWNYVADPGFLIVGPTSPQQPISLFEVGQDWDWSGGHYCVTLVVVQQGDPEPITASFDIVVDADTVERLQTHRGTLFLLTQAELDPECEGVISRLGHWQWPWEW
jgi:hypothetical protein